MTGDSRVHHSASFPVIVGRDGKLASHHVLQGFDRVRRLLAVQAAGTEGVFTGYNTLEMQPNTVLESGELAHLTVTALLLSGISNQHRVEYVATVQRDGGEQGRPPSGEIVARGIGVTLLLPDRATTTPGQDSSPVSVLT